MFLRAIFIAGCVAAAPGWTAADEVVEARSEAFLRKLADVKSGKRGAVAPHARFAVAERKAGPGCKGDWLRIATAAWLCADETRVTEAAPGGPKSIALPQGEVTPYTYVLGKDVTAYDTVEDAVADANGHPLPGASGLKLRGRVERDGKTIYRTSKGYVVAGAGVKIARPSPLQGVALDEQTAWPIGLVADADAAKLYDARGKVVAAERMKPPVRGEALYGLKPSVELPGGVAAFPLADDLFVAARAVRLVEKSPRPDEVGAAERWIDVDLAQQVLIAYEGDHPIYATLISTALNTPKGIHRVETKLPHPLLESTEKYSDAEKYRYETPWVMRFDGLGGRYAMHAVYWHSGFGQNRGQGCVNLSPRDAAYVWDFSAPAVPEGWTYAVAADEDGARGTVVRIR